MFVRRRFAHTVLFLAASLGAGAQAQETPNERQISLQAQAQREVVHDLMRVTLYTEAQGLDTAQLAEQTTRILNAATERARAVTAVRVQTGGRTTYPVYEKNRQRIAAWARQRSGAAQRHKTVEILDVNGDAIASALRASATSMLIHGHTHRPAHHVIAVDGHPRARFVLSDWDLDHTTPGRMAWLRVDAQGVQTISGGAPS